MEKQKSSPRFTPEIKAYFAQMGSIGGKLGGKIRSEKLSPERRREIAQKAIAARWAKRASEQNEHST